MTTTVPHVGLLPQPHLALQKASVIIFSSAPYGRSDCYSSRISFAAVFGWGVRMLSPVCVHLMLPKLLPGAKGIANSTLPHVYTPT